MALRLSSSPFLTLTLEWNRGFDQRGTLTTSVRILVRSHSVPVELFLCRVRNCVCYTFAYLCLPSFLPFFLSHFLLLCSSALPRPCARTGHRQRPACGSLFLRQLEGTTCKQGGGLRSRLLSPTERATSRATDRDQPAAKSCSKLHTDRPTDRAGFVVPTT